MKRKVMAFLKKDISTAVLGALLPSFALMLLHLIFMIYPNSNVAMAPYDALHQYVPFLQIFKEKILSGENFFFSVQMASSDFYLEWLYYLTSPINLLCLLFDDIFIAFQTIIIVKISLIGLSFSIFLKKCIGGKGIRTAIFSCAYALSGYVMAYYFCTLWLDVLMLFPWLILSFHMMMENKKPWLYPLLLAAVIYSNFFMAMHVCIFLCVYFLLYGHKSIKEFFRNGLRFASLSILGGGLGAMFFIPFIPQIGGKQGRYRGTYLLTDFASLFMDFGAASKKNTSMSYSSNANFYCGIIVLILFVMYLFNKKYDVLERIRTAIIIGFLFLCTNVSDLDYFMNGLYIPNGYMGRYTYILIFFIVSCAYKEFLDFRKEKKKKKIAVSIVIAFMFFLSFLWLVFFREIDGEKLFSVSATIMLCFAFILISCTYLFFRRHTGIAACLLVELVFSMSIGFVCSDIKEIIDTKNIIESFDVDTDNRSVIFSDKLNNQGFYYGLNGLGLFSSCLPLESAETHHRFGMRGGSNYTKANGAELIPSLLYNIEYIYSERDNILGFTKTDEYDGVYLYKNDYETSYAYRVPSAIKNWEYNTNSFHNLDSFSSFFTDKKIFTQVKDGDIFIDTNYEKAERKFTEDGMVKVDFEKGNGSYFEASIIAQKKDVAVIIKNGNFSDCKVYINNSIYLSDKDTEGDIIYLKDVEVGDKISVYCNSDMKKGTMTVMFAYYDMAAFEKFAEEFSSRRLDVSFNDNGIKGNGCLEDGEAVLISVYSSDGWDLKVNGSKTEFEDFYYLLFEGTGEISFSMTYITPLFIVSACISAASVIVLIVFVLYKTSKQKASKKILDT